MSPKVRFWVGILLALFIFGILTVPFNYFHDEMFLAHTSIQDRVPECTGGRYGDCESLDGVRAYDTQFWAVIGNSVGLIFDAFKFAAAYFAFRSVCKKGQDEWL